MNSDAPSTLAVQPEHIPAELKDLPQWVGWRWLQRDGKLSKPPVDVRSGRYAKPNDPATWASFDEALAAYQAGRHNLAGIGYMFTAGDGLVGVDLDDCIVGGTLLPWASEILAALGSYAEVSPSGTGVKAIARGALPADGANKPSGWPVEVYRAGRYFAMTGHRLPYAPAGINQAQAAITALWERIHAGPAEWTQREGDASNPSPVAAPPQPGPGPDTRPAPSDAELLAIIGRSAQAAKFERLMAGDASGYASPSQADMALCNLLAFYTADPDQVDRIFRQSGLHREKWDAVHSGDGRTYGQITIADALAYVRNGGNVYSPDYRSPGRQKPASAARKAASSAKGDKAGKDKRQRPAEAHREGGAPPGLAEPPGWPPLADILEAFHRAETGDAELLAALYAGRIAFDHAERAWHVWHGHHWARDERGQVGNLPGRTLAACYLYAAAEVLKGAKDDDEKSRELAKDLQKRAGALRYRARRANILDLASSQESLAITGREWDADPWVLAVQNGVIDLRTGELRPGQPADYLRTVAPTAWAGLDPPAPRWERFLSEIFDADAELVAFVHRLLGYGITGESTEHVLPILWGKGWNGKDTLLKALGHVLGPGYADAVPAEVFIDPGRANGAAPSPHLYKLRGLRLAWASESDEGAKLKAGQVKAITGGGIMTARPMYGNPVSWAPSHLAMLITNHRPHAPADDYALWKRIALVPFTRSFVDKPKAANERRRDPDLDARLRAEAPGILAWLVRGCLAWQREGLQPPAAVAAATEQYQVEEDTLGLWLDERCITGEGYQVRAKDLYADYRAWCDEMSVRPLTGTTFGRKMGERFTKKQSNGVHYVGVGLQARAE